MANAKEIRIKIRSVQNTQKITKAMETVAASKMKRAQDLMRSARPYAERIRRTASHLVHSMIEKDHPFLASADQPKKVGVILVTSDKGLCGGMNTNLFRMLSAQIKAYADVDATLAFAAFGSKGLDFLRRMGAQILARETVLGDRPKAERLIGPVKLIIDQFLAGEIDAVFLCYTRFINTMRQEPTFEQLLPMPSTLFEGDALDTKRNWEYIYEPDKATVLEELFRRYIEHLVYRAVTENNASEQSARMVAMKAASDNAEGMIGRLRLEYNKMRQAAITTELSEIVSGAAAV